MRILVVFAVACLAATTSALAQSTDTTTQSESRPSEESVRHLLEVMQAQKVLQTLTEQMDGMFDSMVQKQLEGQNVTPEQRQEIEARRKVAGDMIKDLLKWDSMESLYLKVYEDTFTQEEIDGMAAFYASPAGRAVIAKLPLAAKNTLSEMQQRMQQMIPKLQQMAREAAEAVKAQGPAKKSG
jgi:uncharacterized protein